MGYLAAVYGSVTELSPEELIGSLMVGMLLALACSGLCLVLQKRISNALPVFCGLIFLVASGSMACGVGHARYRLTEGISPHDWGNPDGFTGPSARPWPPMPPPLGWQLLREADADGDGRLTPEEAAKFVREADPSGKGWADATEIDRAVRDRRDHPAPGDQRPLPIPGHASQVPMAQ